MEAVAHIESFAEETPFQVGHQINDLDVRSVTPDLAQEIRDLVYKHKLLVFKNQDLTNEEYIVFARAIGRPQIYFQTNYHHPDHPEIFVSSNVAENGRKVGVAGTGRYWHTDCQFFPEPLPLTMLYPREFSEGKRETYYIDMGRVYRRMPDTLKERIAGKRAIHDAKYRYKVTADDIDRSILDLMTAFETMAPPVTHPAVIKHPRTGESLLYVSSGFTTGIEGYSQEEGGDILRRLFDFIELPEHVTTISWVKGDILLWDNRSLLHRAGDTAKGQKSCSYRIGIYDDLPFHVGIQTASAGG